MCRRPRRRLCPAASPPPSNAAAAATLCPAHTQALSFPPPPPPRKPHVVATPPPPPPPLAPPASRENPDKHQQQQEERAKGGEAMATSQLTNRSRSAASAAKTGASAGRTTHMGALRLPQPRAPACSRQQRQLTLTPPSLFLPKPKRKTKHSVALAHVGLRRRLLHGRGGVQGVARECLADACCCSRARDGHDELSRKKRDSSAPLSPLDRSVGERKADPNSSALLPCPPPGPLDLAPIAAIISGMVCRCCCVPCARARVEEQRRPRARAEDATDATPTPTPTSAPPPSNHNPIINHHHRSS